MPSRRHQISPSHFQTPACESSLSKHLHTTDNGNTSQTKRNPEQFASDYFNGCSSATPRQILPRFRSAASVCAYFGFCLVASTVMVPAWPSRLAHRVTGKLIIPSTAPTKTEAKICQFGVLSPSMTLACLPRSTL